MVGANDVRPAVIRFLQGGVEVEIAGWHNSYMFGCQVGKTDLAWNIAFEPEQPMVRIVKSEPVRIFYASSKVPEYGIPVDDMTLEVIQHREALLAASRDKDGNLDQERLKVALQKRGLPELKAGYMARFYGQDIHPELQGGLAHEMWLEAAVRPGQGDNWMWTILAGVYGLVYGIQLSDTALPNIGSTEWFTLGIPIALVAAIIWLMRKGGN